MSYESIQLNKLLRLERTKAHLLRQHAEQMLSLNLMIEGIKSYFRLKNLTEDFPILIDYNTLFKM